MSNTKISDATKTTPLATDMIPLARVGSSAALSTRFQDISVVGTITTGTWNGTTIATSYGGTGVTTSTGSGANVLNVSPSLTTPAISGGTIDNSVIGGTTPAAATVMSLTLGGYTNNKKIYQTADNYITILNGDPRYSDVMIDGSGNFAIRGNLTVYGSGSSIPGYLTTSVAASTYQPLLGYAAAHAGANTDITSLGGLTTALSVAQGGTGVTISSGANSVVLRDASANISTNAAFIGFTNIAAGASIILTTSSTPNYVVTGSGGQTFQLPSALTLPVGATFTFNNNQSSGAIAVNNNSATLVVSVPSGGYVTVTLLTNSFASGTWDVHYSTPANVSWSTNTFNVPASITGATWNSTAVGLLYGGTGATTAAGARANLGLGGAALLGVGTTAGTVAAGDDSRLVANGAVVSTSGTGVSWQVLTAYGQVVTRYRDAVNAATVAGGFAGLETTYGLRAPSVVATQSVTINTESLLGGADSGALFSFLDTHGYRVGRVLTSGTWDVPALRVRGALTFDTLTNLPLGSAGEAVAATASMRLLAVAGSNGVASLVQDASGRVRVPALKSYGTVVATDFLKRDLVAQTQVGISAVAITALNANLPTMPTGLPPSPTFSASVATYGPATRHASESMGVAVTGRRIWAAFYGQNSVVGGGPGSATAETDGAYVILAYCDNYPTGTWTECLYILPTAYTGSGGAGVGRCIDPVLYTAPDGRLLVMWKSTGISNVTDTTITNTAVMAFLIQNPQARAGAFVVGRLNYLGVGRPEAPAMLGNDVYMLNDQASGTITWGKLTASGADSITYSVLNTLPALPTLLIGGVQNIALECSWAPLSSGEVIALFRTQNGLYTATSTAGVTGWNTATQWLPSNGRGDIYCNPTGGAPNGSRAAIMRSPDSGLMMVVFNFHATQRYNPTAIFSADDGGTWPWNFTFDHYPRNAAYFALAYDDAGRVLVAGDHDRGSLTQEMIVWRFVEDSVIAGSPLLEKSIVAYGVV